MAYGFYMIVEAHDRERRNSLADSLGLYGGIFGIPLVRVGSDDITHYAAVIEGYVQDWDDVKSTLLDGLEAATAVTSGHTDDSQSAMTVFRTGAAAEQLEKANRS